MWSFSLLGIRKKNYKMCFVFCTNVFAYFITRVGLALDWKFTVLQESRNQGNALSKLIRKKSRILDSTLWILDSTYWIPSSLTVILWILNSLSWIPDSTSKNFPDSGILILPFILLQDKVLQFDWLRAAVFQLNLKYLHVKITNLLRVVV